MPDSLARSDERLPLIKRILPRTLMARSLLIILAPLVLMQIIATWFFFDKHYDVITKRLAQGVAGGVAAVIELMKRDPSGADRPFIFHLAEKTLWFRISFEEGAQLPPDAVPPTDSTLERHLVNALTERLQRPFLLDATSLPKDVEFLVQLPNGVLRILVRRELLFSDTTYIFILWLFGSSAVLFGVALVFMRNQVRPIRRLALAAEGFGKGRDPVGFRMEGATEVRQAAAAFLQMRARIKRQIEQRTAMLAGVSHDLRTPLTRMKLELALMPPSPSRDSLEHDVVDMEHMIEGYLAFARGEGTEQAADTQLADLVSQVVEQARRGGREVMLEVKSEASLPLRPNAVKRALANLVENGLRHGERVTVTLDRTAGGAVILVDDDGPGVAEADREIVFKPFYRLEPGRDPNRGGAGLGLTIARDVARGHGGDVTLEASPGGGLRARLRLPL